MDGLSAVQTERLNDVKQRFDLSHESMVKELRSYGASAETDSTYTLWGYGCHLSVLLLRVKNGLEALPDSHQTVTGKESRLIENGVLLAIEYSLRPLLRHPHDAENSSRLLTCVNILSVLLTIRPFWTMHKPNKFTEIAGALLEGIFTLKAMPDCTHKSQLDTILLNVNETMSPPEVFKVLFYIKNQRQDSREYQQAVHRHLLHCLTMPGGFIALCAVLIPSADGSCETDSKLPPGWKSCEVISKIIASKGHQKAFYRSITNEICRFLADHSVEARNENPFFKIAAVQCLTRLSELPYRDIKDHIHQSVLGGWDVLAEPTDLLKGLIIYDEPQFLRVLELTHVAFCVSGPSDITFASNLLTPYVPLLTQLYAQFDDLNQQGIMNKIGAIVVRCLSNRSESELNDLVDCILFQKDIDGTKLLHLHPMMLVHPRVINAANTSFSVQIGSNEVNDESIVTSSGIHFYDASATISRILKESNHNILIYNVFLHLLELFSNRISRADGLAPPPDTSLIGNSDEFTTAVERHFKRNLMIISALNELIAHKPLHSQFNSNPSKLLDLFDEILRKRIAENQKHSESAAAFDEDQDELLLIILSLLQEILYKIQNDAGDDIKRLRSTLTKLRSSIVISGKPSKLVLQKLDLILDPPLAHNYEDSRFATARTLIVEATEPHLKVYGITEIIKLLSTKDTEALSNAHSMLAIAIKLLKDGDSYVFLNCIRLLTVLMNVIGRTVLDTLLAEYQQEDTDSMHHIDYRLKIGETIVKVVEGLGRAAHIHTHAIATHSDSTNLNELFQVRCPTSSKTC